MSTGGSFQGFPKRMEFITIPLPFIVELMPNISNIVELKVILDIFRMLYQQKRYPKFITLSELFSNNSLAASHPDESGKGPLNQIVEELNKKNIIIALEVNSPDFVGADKIIMVNTPANKILLEKIASGEIRLPLFPKLAQLVSSPQADKPNIYTLYEQNIGLLTPIIAEELKDAEAHYPISWIEDAFKEAVSLNRRSWRYIERILERWSTEGKTDGKTGRHSGKKITPEEYFKGKFGHIVQR